MASPLIRPISTAVLLSRMTLPPVIIEKVGNRTVQTFRKFPTGFFTFTDISKSNSPSGNASSEAGPSSSTTSPRSVSGPAQNSNNHTRIDMSQLQAKLQEIAKNQKVANPSSPKDP